MLIQKMIKKYRVTSYSIAVYRNEKNDSNTTSLLRYNGGSYYDVNTEKSVNRNDIIFSRLLTSYINYEKRDITDAKASKLARVHYTNFQHEFVKCCLNSDDKKVRENLGLENIIISR